MILELVAAVSAGLGLAGLALLLRVATRRRLPAWTVPAAAGLGMLAFAIWSESTWYGRTAGALPPGVVVARAVEDAAPWRPWTYVWPIVTRFSAVDTRARRTNAARPGEVLTSVILVARWAPLRTLPVLFDCGASRMAALSGEDLLPSGDDDEAGDEPGDGPDWVALPASDEALSVACEAR